MRVRESALVDMEEGNECFAYLPASPMDRDVKYDTPYITRDIRPTSSEIPR